MPRGTILIVEDDPAIRRGVRDALKFAGFDPLDAADGEAGRDAALSTDVDLVLLDIRMPRLDGVGVLRAVREAKPWLPVIFLTAKGEEHDRVAGLRQGADDYIVKPFGPAELIARVEAVLRRSPERPRPVPTLTISGRTVDLVRREVRFADGSAATLSAREAEVLRYLASHPDRPVSRDELLTRVWGVDAAGAPTRAVDMTVARLREALRDDPADPAVVLTIRGAGYALARDKGG